MVLDCVRLAFSLYFFVCVGIYVFIIARIGWLKKHTQNTTQHNNPTETNTHTTHSVNTQTHKHKDFYSLNAPRNPTHPHSDTHSRLYFSVTVNRNVSFEQVAWWGEQCGEQGCLVAVLWWWKEGEEKRQREALVSVKEDLVGVVLCVMARGGEGGTQW